MTTLSATELHDWQARLDAARSNQPAALKASAATWVGYIATLVGAFAAISVVVAPKALADFTNSLLLGFTLACLVLAGVTGLFALFYAIRAAGTWPEIHAKMDATAYHDAVTEQSVNGVRWLSTSRACTVVSVALVLIGSGLSVYDTLSAPPKDVNAVVINKDGTAQCGPIAVLAMTKTALSITVVAHC
jgi:hypothetical protein